MRPFIAVLGLLTVLCANCQERLPDVSPPGVHHSLPAAEDRCTEMVGEINDQPSRTDRAFQNGIGPSQTLAGMVSTADAIVVASIIGERFDVSPTCQTATLVTLGIEDVIKDHARIASPNGRLVVWRAGGKRREGNVVARVEMIGYPSFKAGEKYLLLLSWNEIQERWDAAFPYNALRVDGSILTQVADYGALTENGRGKTLSEFSARLRQTAARP